MKANKDTVLVTKTVVVEESVEEFTLQLSRSEVEVIAHALAILRDKDDIKNTIDVTGVDVRHLFDGLRDIIIKDRAIGKLWMTHRDFEMQGRLNLTKN